MTLSKISQTKLRAKQRTAEIEYGWEIERVARCYVFVWQNKINIQTAGNMNPVFWQSINTLAKKFKFKPEKVYADLQREFIAITFELENLRSTIGPGRLPNGWLSKTKVV